jgi:hypothetical protein
VTVLVRVLDPAEDVVVYDSTLPFEDVHDGSSADEVGSAVEDARFFWHE